MPTGMTGEAAEAARVAAARAYGAGTLGPDDPLVADLTGLCELAAGVTGTATAVVNLIDDRTQHQLAAFGTVPASGPREQGMSRMTLEEGTDVVVPDTSADERFASLPWIDGRTGRAGRYLSVLLRTPQGQAIGTLCAYDERPGPVDDEQVRRLRLLARQVVSVLELRLRTRQLERSNEELAGSRDRLASFAGQVSHDLKAPITAILGFAELLQELDAVLDDPVAASYVGRCSSAAGRMLATVEDMLGFARIGGTQQPVPNALDTVVPQVLDDLGRAVAGAEVSWSGVDVPADSAQLRALLQNLVGNALAYRGERPCRVTITSEPVADGGVVLRVADNGPGIPAERREDVLRPLVRLRSDVPGAGLGLAVCARVMDAHGGTLRLDETPGGGTTITAFFPAR